MDEYLAAASLHQWTKAFSHAPADVAKNLQAVGPGNKKCQTAVAEDANGLGKTFKGLQVKAGDIETLELFFGKHSALSNKQSVPQMERFAVRPRDVNGLNAEC